MKASAVGLFAMVTCATLLIAVSALPVSAASTLPGFPTLSQIATCSKAASGTTKLTKADLSACAGFPSITKPCPSGPGLRVININSHNIVLRQGQRPVRLPKNYTFNQLDASCFNKSKKSRPASSAPKSGQTKVGTSTSAPQAPNLLAVWCELTIGESKTAVLQAMGTPHGSEAASWTTANGISGDIAEWDNVNGDLLLASFQNGVATNLQAYAGTIGPVGATNLNSAAFRH